MSSFELTVDDELSLAGSAFLARVTSEMRRAASAEKAARKLTQQSIASDIKTSRHVINRQMQGIENIGARRIGEIFHVLGWEPFFEARPIPREANERLPAHITTSVNFDRPDKAVSSAPALSV
jgi:hypothetical protein